MEAKSAGRRRIGAKGPIGIRRLRYVFTRAEGARVNLMFFAKQFRDDQRLIGHLSVQVFDDQGIAHMVTSNGDAEELLKRLGGVL